MPDANEGRQHNSRGVFIGGPRFVTPSDLLAEMIGPTHCREPAPVPREARRRQRLYSAREARRRFLRALRDAR